jgi:hypothetical protein
MTDVFDTTILCKKCNVKMQPTIANREGFELRAVKCPKCGDIIIHPADVNGLEHFNNIKGKTFNVKLRVVGNSHAVSIPKEIISFMEEQHRSMRKRMDDMVRLCFEDFDKLSLKFGDEDFEEDELDENRVRLRKENRRKENEKTRRN